MLTVREYTLAGTSWPMPHPIRLAILDAAGDDANLWELPWAVKMVIREREVEIHPRRRVEEVRPHLLALLREGKVEMHHDEPNGTALSLGEAVAAASINVNWDPEAAQARYCVSITASGDHEYEVEYQAQHPEQ